MLSGNCKSSELSVWAAELYISDSHLKNFWININWSFGSLLTVLDTFNKLWLTHSGWGPRCKRPWEEWWQRQEGWRKRLWLCYVLVICRRCCPFFLTWVMDKSRSVTKQAGVSRKHELRDAGGPCPTEIFRQKKPQCPSYRERCPGSSVLHWMCCAHSLPVTLQCWVQIWIQASNSLAANWKKVGLDPYQQEIMYSLWGWWGTEIGCPENL